MNKFGGIEGIVKDLKTNLDVSKSLNQYYNDYILQTGIEGS